MIMQDFQNGVAPPPPVADSWRRIDHWTEENYPELFDQLTYGASGPDVDELEHELEMNLPGEVRESFYIHDGQERGGRPTGLFFGIALLDCEELADEYNLWKKVAASLPRPNDYPSPLIGSSRPNGLTSRREPSQNVAQRKPPRQARQVSRPEGAIQLVYAHPGWIPMAKDYQGNNIAIDLSPGPQGRIGQVILYGRDYDTKYVVAPSWAAFLASFVSDLESDHVVVDEDVGVGGEMGQLRFLVDPDKPDMHHTYLEILKARVIRRDRAMRGTHPEAASSKSSLHNQARRNGKGRAQSPPKGNVTDRLPRSNPRLNGQAPSKAAAVPQSTLINGLQKEDELKNKASAIADEADSVKEIKPIPEPVAPVVPDTAAEPIVSTMETVTLHETTKNP